MNKSHLIYNHWGSSIYEYVEIDMPYMILYELRDLTHDRSVTFEFTEAGKNNYFSSISEVQRGGARPLHSHDFYELTIVLSGELHLQIENEVITYFPGDACLCNKNIHHRELLDEDAQALLSRGEDPFELPNLRYTLNVAESQAINDYKGPAVVISASGMCNAGRIKHHLKHNIWRPGASIVFVGYQAVGTPGRKIVDKAKTITLFGEDMEVAARIYTIGGFSAHAGQSQLLDWLKPLAAQGSQVVLVHGEEKAQGILAGLIKEQFGISPLIPAYLEEMTLEGAEVRQTVLHEAKAHPRVDWDFLTSEVERKWGMFKDRLADLEQRPWVEQTDLQDALEKMDYALTRLISRM